MASFQEYTGLWYDHSQSGVFGATLTLPIRYSNYLVSALTVAVTFSASCFWIVLAFVLHQMSVNGHTTDVLGLQHQVILRNSASPLGSLWELTKVLLAWRKSKARNLTWRTLKIGVPAILAWLTFTAASILVAEVSSKNFGQIQVLLAEGNCGFVHFSDGNIAFGTQLNSKYKKDAINAQTYARNWYNGSSASLTSLSLFPVTTLPFENSTNTPCPFAEALCTLGPNSAFSLQTDLLDSGIYFGINAPESDRISIQKNLTCSVLNVDDYSDLNGTFFSFFLGPVNSKNVSYKYDYTNFYTSNEYYIYTIYYDVDATNAINVWQPIPDLWSSDVDIGVFFMSAEGILYSGPNNDPWFRAQQPVPDGELGIVYQPNNSVNVMGCTEKYRICTKTACGPFGGSHQLVNNTESLQLNLAQLASAARFYEGSTRSSVLLDNAALGSSGERLRPFEETANLTNRPVFLASNVVSQGFSDPLPSNQWQLEVQSWFETSLAELQSQIVQYAANDNSFGPSGTIVHPSDFPSAFNTSQEVAAALATQCKSQKIQSSGQVQSFSVLGLAIVFCVALVLMIISMTLESCVSFSRSKKSPTTRSIALQSDSKFHLLRMALSFRDQQFKRNRDIDDDQERGSGESQRTNIPLEKWEIGANNVPIWAGAEFDIERPQMDADGISKYKHIWKYHFDGSVNGEKASLLQDHQDGENDSKLQGHQGDGAASSLMDHQGKGSENVDVIEVQRDSENMGSSRENSSGR